MDIATTTDTHKNNRLDAIGQKIVFGENPYHTTDAYKENIAKRIAQIFEEA
jgi:acetate kinase